MEEIRTFYDEIFQVEDTESFMSRSAPEWARYATGERIRVGAGQVKRLAKSLKGGRLLDLGCGDGVALRRFEKDGLRVEMVGADLSAVALRKAMAAGTRAHFMVCDSNHLPFRDSQFDVILCTEVLEHVLEPGAMLLELGRVCAGSLVLTTPCFGPDGSRDYEGWAERWNSHIRKMMDSRGVGAMLQETPILAGSSLHTGHVNAFTPSRLRSLLAGPFSKARVRGIYFNFPLLMLALQKRPQLAKYHRALQSMILQRIPLFCTFIGGGDAVGNFEALVVASKGEGGSPSPGAPSRSA